MHFLTRIVLDSKFDAKEEGTNDSDEVTDMKLKAIFTVLMYRANCHAFFCGVYKSTK
jgi:hypothetical protein